MVFAQGLNASKPSLFAQACSKVPFKTTFGLSLGLIGACAYCWYKLPQLEEQLRKAQARPYSEYPKEPKSKIRDTKAELDAINRAQIIIKKMISAQSKVTPESKKDLQDLKERFSKIQSEKKMIVGLIETKMRWIEEKIEKINKHKEDYECYNIDCLHLESDRQELLEWDQFICSNLDLMNKECDDLKEALAQYPGSHEYKKALAQQKNQETLHKVEVERVDKHNKTIALARLRLYNQISSYENLKFNFGVAGLSLALIAGVTKYFSK